jgi:branched-chain amino acid transport system substrate-binding protein
MSINGKAAACVAVMAIVATTAACGSSKSAGGSTGTAGTGATVGNSGSAASAPGVTASDITVGLVTSQTGPAAADFYGNLQGAQARIDLQNAAGGVNHRQLKLTVGDDTSSVFGGQTAVSDLVQQRSAFGLIFLSDFVSSAYRIAQKDGVPVVGWAVDGPEWALQPNTNMVAVEGDVSAAPAANTLEPKVAKLAGATNMASFAIGGEQPSVLGAQAFTKAAKSVGLKVGYDNYSIPVGTVNVTAMQQAHVDGFASFMLDTTDFAIISGARQAGLKLVAPISVTGYGQALLDDASARQAAQGAIFGVDQVPVEERTAATKAEQAAFAQYEHFTGVPSLSWTAGWTSADLFIKGLEGAGQNPTRSSFLAALHGLKGWTAGGLLPTAADFSLANFGQAAPTSCSYYVKLEGTSFVGLNNGKVICGTNVN